MDASSRLLLLLPRKLFDSDNDKGSVASNHSCPWHPPIDQVASRPLYGNVTFHDFELYFSGACAAFSVLVAWALIVLHATHFSRPQEQRKIIRITSLVPAYALLSWLSIFSLESAAYLDPWLDVLQAACLATFFLLLNEFVSDAATEREVFFAALKIPERKSKSKKGVQYDTTQNGLAWYRKKWIAIFQYVIVALVVAVVSNITEAAGVYCEYSSGTGHAHLWLEIIINISTALAVAAIIQLYVALKTDLAHHRPLLKLACFKAIVGVSFIVSIIFLILNGVNALNPTDQMTWGDLKSLPNMIECIVMVPISIFFHIAYPWTEYRLGGGHDPLRPTNASVPAANREYQGGFLGWKAYVLSASPMEIFRGLVFTFKMASEMQKVQDTADAGLMTGYQQAGQRQDFSRQPSPYRTPSPYRGPGTGETAYDAVHFGRRTG